MVVFVLEVLAGVFVDTVGGSQNPVFVHDGAAAYETAVPKDEKKSLI